jgi:hypothetical protein
MRRFFAAAVTAVATLLATTLSTPAAAQEAAAFQPDMASQRIGGELSWWSATRFGSSFGLVPFLNYRLADELYLDVKLPLAMNFGSRADKLYASPGNPTVGVHYDVSHTATTAWYIGGRVGVPLVHLIDDDNARLASTLGAYTSALYDLHLWVPDHLPVGFFAGVESAVARNVIVRGELAPEVHMRLRERSGDNGAEFLYQGRIELEARGESGWGGGAAVRLVHLVSSEADDTTQSAFDLFGSYTTPSALFARLGMLVAMDQPLGAGFDTGKVLTLHGALGTRF